MLTFAGRALAYSAGMSQADWAAARMRYDATLRNLALIGEAASRVPAETRDTRPELPWR